MNRGSFVFYESFHTALSKLDAETYKTVMMAVCEYALYGEEPELDGLLGIVFDLIKPQIDANNKRYEDGKKGGRPSKKPQKPVVSDVKTSGFEGQNQWLSGSKPNVNVNVNDNDNVNENVNVSVGLTPDTAPTLDEIKEYCTERGNKIDPVKFREYYQMRDWKLSGGKQMKDWKAAVRYWETREEKKPNQNAKPTKFSNYTQERTEVDWNAKQREVIQAQLKQMMEG